MGFTKRAKKYLAGAALAASVFFSQPAKADEPQPRVQRIQQAAINSMRDEGQSLLPASEGMHFNIGGNIDDFIFNYLFRVPGRVRWAQTYPNRRFGQHRENSRDLNWNRRDSRHFMFLTTDNNRLNELAPMAEETYDDFSRRMGVTTFNEKIRVHYFSDRIAFEQMGMFPGIVPEGLGGITEIMEEMHNKVVFLNEGEKEFMYHVGRHELSHRFRIEQFRHIANRNLTSQMPLWFIEGIAEHDSLRMDSSIDASVRDAYFNGFLELGISPMLQGTRFMYDAGTVYTNYIADHFGENALNRIVRETARGRSFESSLRISTGLSVEELSRKVNEELSNKFGNRFSRNGLEDLSDKLGEMVVLAADNQNFIIGKAESLQDSILIARRTGEGLVTERLDADRVPGSDSLHRFRHGADISENRLAYVVRDGVRDVIRVKRFNFEDNEFEVNDGYELSFSNITFIKNPRLVDFTKIAFVGMQNGNMDLYLYDTAHESLTRLTNNNSGIRGMDYNKNRNSLVFSLESELRTSNPSKCDFNYDLYELNLESQTLIRLTETDFDETNPSISPDGRRIVFNTDEHGSKDLAVYDYNIARVLALPRVRIAANVPVWRTSNRIAFTSINEMEPVSYSYSIQDSVSLLHNNLRWNSRPNRSEHAMGNMNFRAGRISIRHHGRNFSVNQAVAGSEALYFRASANNETNIFKVEENGARALLASKRKSLESLLETNERARESYGRFREQNSVIESVLSPDQKYIVSAVNNRLSFSSDEQRSEYPVLIYMQNLETSRITRLPMISLDDVENLKRFLPLENGRVLIYVTEPHWIGSTDHKYLLYDISTNRLEDLNASLITIDRNRRFIFGIKQVRDEDRVFVYDSQTGNKRFLNLDIDNYDTANITQTAAGEFLVREEGAHNGCRHYALVNPSDLSYRSFDLSRKLRGRNIVTDMMRLDDGSFAMVQHPIRGSDYRRFNSNSSSRGELYVLRNSKLKRVLHSSINASLLGNDGNTLLVSERPNGNIVAIDAEEHIGVAVNDAEMSGNGQHIAYSDSSNVYLFNINESNSSKIRNTFGFDIEGTKLAYAVYRNGSFDIFEKNLDTGQTRVIAGTRSNEILPMIARDGRVIFLTAPEREHTTTSVPLARRPTTNYGLVSNDLNQLPTDYVQLSIQGIATLHEKFLMMSFNSTDILEERVFSLNYMGNIDDGFNLGMVSYADISRGYGLSSYINQFSGNLAAGISGMLIFPQSRFTQLDLSLGYDYQDLSMFDFSGPNHVLKLGLGYGHDSSLRGIHGPRDGNRLSAYAELGFSLNNQELSNADVYLAGRKYVHFCDYAYLALAGDVGTSQGISPTLILNGGNMSLRGVSFGSLLGNNIAMARSEARLNIIQAAGIQLVKPIEGLSVLSLTPIPEIGWYNDVGATWYYNAMGSNQANQELPFQLYYSGGPTLNITTFFGLVARFNFPLYGNAKEWNFWLGYVGSNW